MQIQCGFGSETLSLIGASSAVTADWTVNSIRTDEKVLLNFCPCFTIVKPDSREEGGVSRYIFAWVWTHGLSQAKRKMLWRFQSKFFFLSWLCVMVFEMNDSAVKMTSVFCLYFSLPVCSSLCLSVCRYACLYVSLPVLLTLCLSFRLYAYL